MNVDHKLDYSSVWKQTQTQLASHREGVAAIAGAFLFLPDWVARLFSGQPDLEGVKTPAAMMAAFQDFYAENWPLLLPAGLISLFGATAIYILLTRKDMPTIGAVLRQALILLPFYFLIQLIGGFATLFGVLLLILPGLYLAGRLTPLAPVTAAEAERGVSGIIARSWELSRGNGWSIFFLTLVVALVASLTAMVIGVLIGLVCRLTAGPEGIAIIETGVDAALGAAIATIMISLSVAIYRDLSVD
jgi:hypothetical protein